MWQFFDERGYPVSVVQEGHHRTQLIDRQSAPQAALKENTDCTPFILIFHPALTTTQLNLSFLKTLNYFKTIQRLLLSFRNPH